MTGRSDRSSQFSGEVFVKRRSDAPRDFFAWEAAGLAWLGEAAEAGGAAVVGVREVGDRQITLDRIEPARPTASAAEALGRALAISHATGAPAFGAGPPGWRGDGFIGRQALMIKEFRRWGEFYASTRLQPYAIAAERRGTLSPAGAGLPRCWIRMPSDSRIVSPKSSMARRQSAMYMGAPP